MDSILHSIEQACRTHGMAPSTFGRLAIGDPRLIHDLQRGRELLTRTEASVVAFLANMATTSSYEPQRNQSLPGAQHRAMTRRRSQSMSVAQHRTMMCRGSAALLAAILTARGA